MSSSPTVLPALAVGTPGLDIATVYHLGDRIAVAFLIVRYDLSWRNLFSISHAAEILPPPVGVLGFVFYSARAGTVNRAAHWTWFDMADA